MTQARAVQRFFPVFFFLAWAIAFTFPLILHLGDAVVLARGSDAWLHLWDLWWVDKSLIGLHQNPFHTNFIYYPTGVNLYYHSLDLFNGLLSIPIQRLFELTATFNLLMLANLTLDGLAAYWLYLDRTGSFGASLVGGALFASAPLLGTSVNLAQLDEVTAWWMPLYLLALLRALDSPGPVWAKGGGRRATLVAGLCLVGASLATWYFTAGLAIFTVLFVPAYLIIRRNTREKANSWWQAVTKLAAILAVLVVVLSPLLLAMIGERLSGATYMLPALGTTIYNSADLIAPFLPAQVEIPTINGHGGNLALGYVALVLGILALVWGWRRLWPIGLGLLGVIVMSLGPELQVLGNNTGIPMPYALLNNVPFVGASRQPLRFLATAELGLTLLSAFGVKYLLGRIRAGTIRYAVVPVALALVILDLFGIPSVLTGTEIGPAYSAIQRHTEPGAVLELPFDNWVAEAMWHQSLHNKPIVGGYTSRHFPYPLTSLPIPGVAQLLSQSADSLSAPDILSPPTSQTAHEALDDYGIRYVVVHKADITDKKFAPVSNTVQTLFDPKNAIYEDADTTVYLTPRRDATLPLVALADGWYEPEGENTPLHRWTNGKADIWMNVPPQASGHYKLALTAYSYRVPRSLQVILDGGKLAEKTVGTSFQDIEIDLGSLSPGEHKIRLLAPKPPDTPPGDNRKISVGYTKVALVRASAQ